MTDTKTVAALLSAGPKVINVGLVGFADDLRAQDKPAVHVEWAPPAGGNPALIDLLEKLGR